MRNVLLIVGLALMGGAWLLPGHYPPWVSYQQEWVCSMGALCIATSACATKEVRIRWPSIAIMVAVFAAVPLAQRGVGQVRFNVDAILPALYLIGFALSVVAGATLTKSLSFRWVDALMATFVAAGTVSAFIALIQWLQLPHGIFIIDLPPGSRPYGNLAQPNHLSTLLGLGVSGALWSFERRRLSGGTATMLTLCLGAGVVMTQSRTGLLFVGLLGIWWALMRKRSNLHLGPRAIAMGLALFIVSVLAWSPLNDSLLLAGARTDGMLQVGARKTHWASIVDAICKSPWFGYGWMQVTAAQERVALDHPATHEMLQSSHNVILDLMVWMGIPLALIFVIGMLSWLFRHARRCRHGEQWALFVGVGAVLTHAMLEYPLNYTYFLLPFGLVVGSISSIGADAEDGKFADWPRKVFLVPVLLVGCLLVWIGNECLELESAGRQMRLFSAGIAGEATQPPPPPDVVLLDGPRQYYQFWLTPARSGMAATTLDWMRDVSQRNAYPAAMLHYALAAGLNNRPDEAARIIALICKMHSVRECELAHHAWLSYESQYPELRGGPASPSE